MLFASVLAHSQSWAFVQSVGGLLVQPPMHGEQGWALPIRANVSGIETISIKPTAINSGMVCEQTLSEIEGNNIYLTIVTGAARSNASAVCPPAILGKIAPGKYSVFYRGPHEAPVFLSEVSIAAFNPEASPPVNLGVMGGAAHLGIGNIFPFRGIG
jgi:hypothetical protein